MTENATLIVCDDVRAEYNGKLMFIGSYPGNIFIPSDGITVAQLYFFFSYDGPKDKIPSKIRYEVTLPGEVEPRISEIETQLPIFKPEHTRWVFRHFMHLEVPVLRKGKILSQMFLDGRKLDIVSPWIEIATAVVQPDEQSGIVPPG